MHEMKKPLKGYNELWFVNIIFNHRQTLCH